MKKNKQTKITSWFDTKITDKSSAGILVGKSTESHTVSCDEKKMIFKKGLSSGNTGMESSEDTILNESPINYTLSIILQGNYYILCKAKSNIISSEYLESFFNEDGINVTISKEYTENKNIYYLIKASKNNLTKIYQLYPNLKIRQCDKNNIEIKFNNECYKIIINHKANAGKTERNQLIDLCHHLNNNTDIGNKFKDEFKNLTNTEIKSANEQGGRTNHFDISISTICDKHLKLEVKGSKENKPIIITKPPWKTGVQFYNGMPKPFTITHEYVDQWYNKYIKSGIFKNKFNITSDIPTFDVWKGDAFCAGKPKSDFVKEHKEKYRTKEVSNSMASFRNEFNKEFIKNITTDDLNTLKGEIEPIYKSVLYDKDIWLQIHGDINDKNNHCFKWIMGEDPPGITIITVKDLSKDIKFKCELENSFYGINDFEAHLRWGYCQGITNLRLDFK